ncbi:hypothetical protein AYI68_g6224 [Smittium mucronatum]|uniref:Uncharacterized protein n=1 Tax=Smittium mucronatum TaxID=133383 RepID=A0A1R0GS78_9FUNG|nr:hypothetical protein AYI68_g6224 [Smittium mucronatum]
MPIKSLNQLHLVGFRGRSKKGKGVAVKLQKTKGTNVHTIGGLSQLEIINFKIKRIKFKSEDCNEWIARLIEE